ncbi:MAG TPA: transglutaminase domain-containing protein [Candidatus Kryptobacter bacterium]|nr:transglutaminase domain-containing protein [Candidatus Kryptobacter bacterium]
MFLNRQRPPNSSMLVSRELRSVGQTIGQMKRIASQYRHDMDSFLGMCPAKFFYFAKKIPYVDDNAAAARLVGQGYVQPDKDGYEFVQRPAFTLQRGGDCDDKATMAAAYMYIQGIPWKFVTTAQKPYEWDHVYLKIFVRTQGYPNGAWLPYDVTISKLDLFQEELSKANQRLPWYKEW